MKLYLTLCMALSVLGNVLGYPPDSFTIAEQLDSFASRPTTRQREDFATNQFEDDEEETPEEKEDYFLANQPSHSNMQNYDADQHNSLDYTIMQTESDKKKNKTHKEGEDKLPAKDVEELKKQIKQKEKKKPAEAQLTRGLKNVMQGSYIAIRSNAHASSYLSCHRYSYYCSTDSCPSLFMEGSDWSRCSQNVFRIYHSWGGGYIRVGDYIGLYSPTNGRWFSMYSHWGHTQSCPGHPHYYYGFRSYQYWWYCGSEIFRIYAKGKGYGQIIEDGDTISLYHPAAGRYVHLGYGVPSLSTCMYMSWYNHWHAYDTCYAEVFEITVR